MTTSGSTKENVWPDRLMIRDTQIVPDDGGGRIYTTVGFGYEKREYIRADLVKQPSAPATVYAGDAFLRTVSKREAHALVSGGTWDLETFNRWCCQLQGLAPEPLCICGRNMPPDAGHFAGCPSWRPGRLSPEPAAVPAIETIRRAVADYMWSEGCSCCRDTEPHDKAKAELGFLLGLVPQDAGMNDGSIWYDFSAYRTGQPETKAEKP